MTVTGDSAGLFGSARIAGGYRNLNPVLYFAHQPTRSSCADFDWRGKFTLADQVVQSTTRNARNCRDFLDPYSLSSNNFFFRMTISCEAVPEDADFKSGKLLKRVVVTMDSFVMRISSRECAADQDGFLT